MNVKKNGPIYYLSENSKIRIKYEHCPLFYMKVVSYCFKIIVRITYYLNGLQ